MQSMKESSIRNYISSIDFKKNEWNINTIKSEMRKFLGEEPAIDISYKRDVMVNEFRGTSEIITTPNKMTVVFTDVDNKFKKLEFFINEI